MHSVPGSGPGAESYKVPLFRESTYIIGINLPECLLHTFLGTHGCLRPIHRAKQLSCRNISPASSPAGQIIRFGSVNRYKVSVFMETCLEGLSDTVIPNLKLVSVSPPKWRLIAIRF